MPHVGPGEGGGSVAMAEGDNIPHGKSVRWVVVVSDSEGVVVVPPWEMRSGMGGEGGLEIMPRSRRQ